MRGPYTPLDHQIGMAQLMGLVALILACCHMADCGDHHAKLIRQQVKAECLRTPEQGGGREGLK